jgi:glycosyltransferase involved in cell wall biosynthesis
MTSEKSINNVQNALVNSAQPKILVVCSTLNLDYPYGATPAIWQLLKGFFEIGCDLIVIPYRGKSVRTLWWRSYSNPTEKEGELYAHSGLHKKNAEGMRKNVNNSIVPKLANIVVTSKWKKLFSHIFKVEKNIDAVLLIGIPLNHFNGLTHFIKEEFSCPVLYYDLDVPTSLPEEGGFSFSYYIGANVSQYDAIIVPSEGVSKNLEDLQAKRVHTVHFGVDPDLYLPINISKDIDVFFYSTSDSDREKEVDMMISSPSKVMDSKFLVSGIKYTSDLTKVEKMPMLPFSLWRNYACRSKINLNITRARHASTLTSTSRPFELAAMNCCIVSSPYKGLDKWFKLGEEIFVANTSEEAMELYKWLFNDENARKTASAKARKHVLADHTFRQRALEIMKIIYMTK